MQKIIFSAALFFLALTATAQTTRIEAENWSAVCPIPPGEWHCVKTDNCWSDGGGLYAGWIDLGDWMDYSIKPSASGNYTFALRIATPNTNAQLRIKKSDGTVLATVNLPNTGDYHIWQTVNTTVYLPAGGQTIRIESSDAGGWNINWFEFTYSGGGGNNAPTANAGTDQTITLPFPTSLRRGNQQMKEMPGGTRRSN